MLNLQRRLIKLVHRRRQLKLDFIVQLNHVLDKLSDLLTFRSHCIARCTHHNSFTDLLQTNLEVFYFTDIARFIHVVEEVCLVKFWLEEFAHKGVRRDDLLLPRCTIVR